MKNLIINIFVIFFSLQLLAQPPQSALEDQNIEVINTFEAKLSEVEKISINPVLPNATNVDKTLVYEIPDKKIDLEYLPPKLRPVTVKKEELPKGYNGHLKLGYGFPNSPYGELGYQYVNPEKFRVGGFLMHHSANNKKIENQRFSNTEGKINGAYFLNRDLAIEADMGFESNQLHFYGYNPEFVTTNRDQVRQRFNKFKLEGKLVNLIENRQGINYEAGFDFYNLTDNFATRESSFDLKVQATKWIKDKHPINVGLRTDFSAYNDGVKQSLNNFFLTPNFTFHGEFFSIKAGLNLASHQDEFYFFPDAEVSVNLVGNNLSAFAGAGGDLYKNNLNSLSDYNPFVATAGRMDIRSTGYRNYYGGLRGSYKSIHYSGEIDYRKAGDLALFVVDPTDTLRFLPVYDSVEIFTLKGTVSAELNKNFNLILTVAQNIYSVQSNANTEAYGLPTLEGNLGVRYSAMQNKLLLKADAFVESGIIMQDENTITDQLGGLFDVSIGAEYYFMQNIGAFFQANNLLGNKRERWYRYPSYGINIVGGVTARF